jgi:uncharacterized protein YjbI with pentapeptide repeats
MANAEQLALLKAGVEGWNNWRKESKWKIPVDLSGANLSYTDLNKADLSYTDLNKADLSYTNINEADLSYTNLSEANIRSTNLMGSNLMGANLRKANLTLAHLHRARLYKANLSEADLRRAGFVDAELIDTNLRKANLFDADLIGAMLNGADLSGANLSGANLYRAHLREANLSEAIINLANLTDTVLVGTNVTNAKLYKTRVYGVSIWDLVGEFKEQKDLIITPKDASPITVDNIKVAQFVYLILNNKEIRDVINTLTSKSVLILGRFAIAERKAILDALRNKLREYDLLPIVFDFDRPTDKDFTETIKTLAGLCYFVIADVTNPKSSPLELQATIPDYQIPFVPIIQEGEQPFAMMVDLQKKYNWVLNTRSYSSKEALINKLKEGIIDPAMEKHNELRRIKAQEPDTVSLG